MIISLSRQVDLLVYSFTAGMIIGVLFDLYRLMRGFSSPKKMVTVIEDILFGIFTAIIIFIFLLYTNYAYIGFYVYMWIGLGIYIYFKFISRLFLKILYNSLRVIIKVIRVFFKILLHPCKLLYYNFNKKKKENKKLT